MTEHIKKLHSPHSKTNKRFHIMLNDGDRRNLAETRIFQTTMAGEVWSTSMILRKALDHFTRHIRDLAEQVDALDPEERKKFDSMNAIG